MGSYEQTEVTGVEAMRAEYRGSNNVTRKETMRL